MPDQVWFLGLAAALFATCAPRAAAQFNEPLGGKNLTGLDQACVEVFATVSDKSNSGVIAGSWIKTQWELELRKVGAKVVDGNSGDCPYTSVGVVVEVFELRDLHGILVFSVDVDFYAEVHQVAPIGDSGEMPEFAVVWETGSFGVASRGSASRYIKSQVSDLLAEFLNDYLRANPA